MSEAKNLNSTDVIAMSLALFEQQFNFRPTDALEKKWFAVTGNRLTVQMRSMLEASAITKADSLTDVVME